jgi:hypothetical protein
MRESFTTTGTVDGKVTNILRDTGADITVVHAKLLKQPDWLNKSIQVTSAFGSKHDLPVARVYISSVYGKGYKNVGVSDHLADPCIIGNQTVESWHNAKINIMKTRN